MYTPEETKSIQKIYQKLFELATGTLRSIDDKDEKNEIEKQLEKVEQYLKSWIEEKGYTIPLFTWQGLTLFSMLVNYKGNIVNSSQNATNILDIEPIQLVKYPLEKLLHEHSKPIWNKTIDQLKKDPNIQSIIPLLFKNKNNKIAHFICTIECLNEEKIISVNALSACLMEFDNIPKYPIKSGKDYEKELVSRVCNFIIEHRSDSIPSTKVLAKKFETNEFTLKAAFRNQLQTSIYKFFTDERLKQSHNAIVQTNAPLKEIAFAFGFNDYTNFFKAFRKKFGYRPSDLKRPK